MYQGGLRERDEGTKVPACCYGNVVHVSSVDTKNRNTGKSSKGIGDVLFWPVKLEFNLSRMRWHSLTHLSPASF